MVSLPAGGQAGSGGPVVEAGQLDCCSHLRAPECCCGPAHRFLGLAAEQATSSEREPLKVVTVPPAAAPQAPAVVPPPVTVTAPPPVTVTQAAPPPVTVAAPPVAAPPVAAPPEHGAFLGNY